jgi:hypothetical protein
MSKHLKSHHDRLLEDVELRQRNTVWPDTLRNGMTVDGYLWKGNPNAPMVQRIGAVVWGLSFLLAAAMWGYMAAKYSFWPLYLFAAGFGYVGFRTASNAFRH